MDAGTLLGTTEILLNNVITMRTFARASKVACHIALILTELAAWVLVRKSLRFDCVCKGQRKIPRKRRLNGSSLEISGSPGVAVSISLDRQDAHH